MTEEPQAGAGKRDSYVTAWLETSQEVQVALDSGGAVHRGAQQSMDVSADLEEHANTRVGARIAVALQRHRAGPAEADDCSRNLSV